MASSRFSGLSSLVATFFAPLVLRYRGEQLFPFDMPAGGRRPRSVESFLQDPRAFHLRDSGPAPAVRRTGIAAAADLIVEKLPHSADHAVVVRLRDPLAALGREDKEPSLAYGAA